MNKNDHIHYHYQIKVDETNNNAHMNTFISIMPIN